MKWLFPAIVPALLASCATAPVAEPQDEFFSNLSELCGRAFEGRVVSPPVDADRDFAGQRLVMHVRDCGPSQIRIPFHVGEDRSRTWVIGQRMELQMPVRGTDQLHLGHDHRHADGTEDRLTGYGGTTVTPGSAFRQEFPADDFSRELFRRENIPQSAANVWAMEVHPRRTFAYELRRPGRYFRVEFDLARPVTPPTVAAHN
ncbi:MAG: hypothetical protein ACXWU2_00445 [Allosphingosinicella sp.]